MPSPFPGMNPFIEACGRWEDFHTQLIGEIQRALAATVPERYFVSLGIRSYIVLAGMDGKEIKPFLPDVGIATPSTESPPRRLSPAVAETVETEAIEMEAFLAVEFREIFIEIHEDDPEERLVTCIEMLSPSNKRRGSEGWDLYVRKRNALLLGTANLVELDLLRGGHRMPMMKPWPNCPYTLLVCRQAIAPRCKVWPAYFHRPLPVLKIPLSAPDADISLDLQSLLAAVYERSRYERRLDYTRSLRPALTEQESVWFAQQSRG